MIKPAIERLYNLSEYNVEKSLEFLLEGDYDISLPRDIQPIFEPSYQSNKVSEYYYDSQLEDVCDMPLNHFVSRILADKSNKKLNELIGKNSKEVSENYRIAHDRILNILGNIKRFKLISKNLNGFAYQMIEDPVIELGFPESAITINSFRAYSGDSEKDFIDFYSKCAEEGIWIGFVIKGLSELKQEKAIDYFIKAYSGFVKKENSLDYFKINNKIHITDFRFNLDFLTNHFGEEKVREKFFYENEKLREDLIKLLETPLC